MQTLHKRIHAFILLSLLLVSTFAVPINESKVNGEQEDDTQKVESARTLQNGAEGEKEAKQVQVPDVPDEDRGQEVINYQDIQVDHNSKVTSESEGQNRETESKEDDDDDTFAEVPFDVAEDASHENEEEEEESEDAVDDDDEFEYMLTPVAARELMLELRDPVEVAKFVVETDDAAGFLRALRLLLHDGYVTEAQAYNLKEEVAAQLRNLLMLQEVELSRALFETYQPQVEDNSNVELEGLLFNREPQPIDYYDYANMINQEDAAYGSSQANIYDAYQDAIEEESSQALAQIAEILAQRIAKGEISAEEGAEIMSKVVQLLPDTYWDDNMNAMSSDIMASEYVNEDDMEPSIGISSETSDLVDDHQGEADDAYSAEEEDVDVTEGEDRPEIQENIERELLNIGPDGLVKEIKEEDENGEDDVAELDGEAENLAAELQHELRNGGRTETMRIQRPGAKAEVKVGPSNDIIDDQVRQDWKDMSLLLDKSIPESVLRSLGISFGQPDVEEEGHKASPADRAD